MKTVITITGAAGRIASYIIPRIGEILSSTDETIELRLLDIDSCMKKLEGIILETQDCAFTFLDKVTCTTDPAEAFTGANLIIMVGGAPRKKGTKRSDLLLVNGQIYKEQAKHINDHAAVDAKVLVIANPCNANAYVVLKNAPNLAKENIFAMTMLDQNRACAQLASKYNLDINGIEDLCVLGNHSKSMFVDFYHAKILGRALTDVINDETWLKEDFIQNVAMRGDEIIEASGMSSAMSAANATIDALSWILNKEPNYTISMGICSKGEYGSQVDNIVSLPCRYNDHGVIESVSNLEYDEHAKSMLANTFAELAEEVRLLHENGLA
ncbi:MAG: malate dehydrogenase [Pseudomonadota bacterium]|nr:malate dehydrogenase [Pseudomonadota bacterium]